jgi:hypothetical protein
MSAELSESESVISAFDVEVSLPGSTEISST